MARINIICEGPTEVRIVEKIIGPHLAENFRHFCYPFDLAGNPKFDRIEHYLLNWINKEPNAWFTTMIDYYGLKPNFPGFSENPNQDYLQKAFHIEKAFEERIQNKLSFAANLIPYFQMYEF